MAPNITTTMIITIILIITISVESIIHMIAYMWILLLYEYKRIITT